MVFSIAPPSAGEVRARLERIKVSVRGLSGVWRVFGLVWKAQPGLTVALALLNVVQGLVPVAFAWLTKLVIDQIGFVAAGGDVTATGVWRLAAIGAAITAVAICIDPTSTYVQVELGDHLRKEIQTRILVKVNSLVDVSYFEDPSFYDKLRRAQSDSGIRPIYLMQGS